MKYLVGLVLILLVAAGGAWVVAGRMAPPAITIEKPEKFVGTATPLQITISAPDAAMMKPIRVAFEQNGKVTQLFSLEEPGKAQIAQEGTDKVRITHEIGKQTVPDLASGTGRIVVTAGRPVMRNLRTLTTSASHDVQVRLERPRVSVVSTHHFINLGGTEIVVYRATPDDVESGVVVGDVEYPGYPAKGATVDGVTINDPALRVAFFALLYDQDLNTPMRVFARDRGRQHRARGLRSPHVPEAVQEEQDPARRQVPRSRRARPSSKARPRSSPTATTSRSSW